MPHRTTKHAGSPVLASMGRAVREVRKERGLSQEVAAVDVGLDRAYYGGVERAEVNLSMVAFVQICSGLGIKPSEMLKRAGM
jgi:transcriptional regulator with XRE-family HTH domain